MGNARVAVRATGECEKAGGPGVRAAGRRRARRRRVRRPAPRWGGHRSRRGV